MNDNLMQNEYMDILAEEIRKEIDATVLFEMYKSRGWYPVVSCRNLSFNHPALTAVQDWLTEGCIGKWHLKSHTDYIFERQEDAMMFALRFT